MYKLNLVGSKESLREKLVSRNIQLYACLNGYTNSLLAINPLYCKLLNNCKVAFVIDGISAKKALSRNEINVDRICGREVLETALKVSDSPIFVVLPAPFLTIQQRFSFFDYFGPNAQNIVAPWLNQESDYIEFAGRLSSLIATNSIVVFGIGSPKQDCLSAYLVELRSDILCLNVGAVVNDIIIGKYKIIKLFSSLRMEWLFRLITNPRRTLPKIFHQVTYGSTSSEELIHWEII